MDISLIFSDNCTLDDLLTLYEKKDISVIIEAGKVTGVEYGS